MIIKTIIIIVLVIILIFTLLVFGSINYLMSLAFLESTMEDFATDLSLKNTVTFDKYFFDDVQVKILVRDEILTLTGIDSVKKIIGNMDTPNYSIVLLTDNPSEMYKVKMTKAYFESVAFCNADGYSAELICKITLRRKGLNKFKIKTLELLGEIED